MSSSIYTVLFRITKSRILLKGLYNIGYVDTISALSTDEHIPKATIILAKEITSKRYFSRFPFSNFYKNIE